MRYILIVVLGLFSCGSKELDAGFSLSEMGLVRLDSLLIHEDSLALGLTFNEKNFSDSLLVLGDGTFSRVHLFSSKSGQKITSFGNNSIKEYPLPEKSYSNSFISGDSLFLLNHLTQEVFCFSLHGQFLDKTSLNLANSLLVLDFENVFKKINDRWYVSSKAEGPLSDVFVKSKLISVFDLAGNLLFSFGEYPKEYSEGPLVLSHQEHFIFKRDKIFSINVAGRPLLKIYDLDGKLISETELSSKFYNSDLGYHSGDPFSAPLTDQINNVAIDPDSDSDIIYLTYSTFSSRDFEQGLSTYRLMLMEINLNQRTIEEAEVLDSRYLSHTAELLPEVSGDTLKFLIRDLDQNLYIKNVKLKRD